MVDSNTVIEGTVKFRDGKKWKSRWCVMRKLSPVADCLHLQLYRDSKDRYKQGQTKASLSLQHFLGVESGFTLDKESNTIAIICQDVTVVLAFDTRERLIQWQVKISNNLGEDQQFLIQITSAPPKAKIASGPARLHVQDQRFCITTGVPPRLIGFWEIGHLRRYGVVEGRFCFEGGSHCGKGEGLHVCVTDQGEEITKTFQLAAQGKLALRRRPVSRKMSAMDSPRKQLHSRVDTRISDLSCTESFHMSHQQQIMGDMNRSICSEDVCCGCSATESTRLQSSEDLLCPCRMHRGTSSPFWSSAESAAGPLNNTDIDSNYGCGDAVSVSDMGDGHHHFHHPPDAGGGWSLTPAGECVGMGFDRRVGPGLERCMSCISKLGAPSMSRSSTATNTNTPTGMPFSPAWTMDTSASSACHHHNMNVYSRSNTIGSSCDRVSLSSHGSAGSSGNSEYCVPRFSNSSLGGESCWYDRPRAINANTHMPVVPPKSPKATGAASSQAHVESCKCPCCPPARPPKPASVSSQQSGSTDSPTKKKMKKPPMPLPLSSQTTPGASQPVCTCRHVPSTAHQQRADLNSSVGPYENYDVPKSVLQQNQTWEQKDEPKSGGDTISRLSMQAPIMEEYYDTPKNIKECLTASGNSDFNPNLQYSNYDTPPSLKTVRKPCGCIIKYSKKSVVITSQVEATKLIVEHEENQRQAGDCPCQRVMCWAENWMMLPYCRRGNGMENTGVPIHKVKLSGEGKMPVVNASGEIAIYATVDKSKKTNRRLASAVESVSETGDSCACNDNTDPNQQPNYANIEPSSETTQQAVENLVSPENNLEQTDGSCLPNYENIDFAQSLEYYENSKDVLSRAGLRQQTPVNELSDTSKSGEEIVSYTINNGIKYCNKCGHACHMFSPTQMPSEEDPDTPSPAPALVESSDAVNNKQDDYLMMEPAKNIQATHSSSHELGPGKNFPGYLPMSPITSASLACNKLRIDQNSEKSASTPSLASPTPPAVDRSRKRSEAEFPRIPGSAMFMHHSANSPYLRKLLLDSADDVRKHNLLTRKRSSSADSSRYLDEFDEFGSIGSPERPISNSQTKLSGGVVKDKPAETVLSDRMSNSSVKTESTHCVHDNVVSDSASDNPSSEEIVSRTTTDDEVTVVESVLDDASSSSSSFRTLVRDCLGDNQQMPQSLVPSSVHIRRSSSVPCKSGNNRDSSSSNDSGVSTGSLKHRGADFAEFELPLTTSMSTRRHHHALSKHAATNMANCLHASLPRRSKSVDPLRDISFQFQKVKVPAKSSSAEAEVPVCPRKSKGFQSPGADGTNIAPYIDSRSTSSGTSDMSDYIETLSLSSHSSSDTPESLRLGRQATTTLRPRSGKEYQLIDRSILEGDMKGEKLHQLRGLVSQYANITPVPEKSESPSPGYMSGSPGQDREDQPLIPHSFAK